MARGWESKAIESQQDDAQAQANPRPSLTAAQRDATVRRQSLELALAQAQSELSASCRPAHRDMLRLKIAALQTELASLVGMPNALPAR